MGSAANLFFQRNRLRQATHGPSTQTFNIVLDLSTGKLNPIIHVAEVNKIIFIGASILFGRARYLIKLLVN